MNNSTTSLLYLSICESCGHYFSLRPYACKNCGNNQLLPRQASGKGTVRAITQVFRAPSTDWQSRAPYSLALIALAEGATVMAHVPAEAVIGDLVEIDHIEEGIRTFKLC